MRHSTDRLKTVLIVLSSIALALGVLATFVVFYPTGSYEPVVAQGTDTATFGNLSSASGTASSTNIFSSSSSPAQTTPISLPAGSFASTYSAPYPVSWQEGHESFSVTGASLTGNQLTIALSLQTGNISECVPMNIRLVASEAGTLQAPTSPAGANFIFPDSGTCNGTPGTTYSESIAFTLDATVASPFLLTTGGASNVFFNIATTTTGSLNITLPGTSG